MSAETILTLVIAGGGTGAAVATLGTGLREYRRQGRQSRVAQFFALRQRLKDNQAFAELAELLDNAALGASPETTEAKTKLEAIPFRVKRDYLGLFEEVALALNAGLIKPEVAHYMFGYYAILCWESDSFWKGVNRYSPYWSLFMHFCEQMNAQRDKLLSDDFRPNVLEF